MTDNNKNQELFDNGRHELINGNFSKSVESLTQVIESNPIHKLALVTSETAY
jgi:hypothetical protein